jgi:hypothetical protein
MAAPTGYSASAAITMVQLRTNEPTALSPTQVLTFLNAGVEQVEAELGGIRLYLPIVTTTGQQTLDLPEDVQDVYSMSFSTGPLVPAPSTAIVYPMFQLEPTQFMNQCAGFPGVGYGNPVYWMAYKDSSGVISIQIYPPAVVGQINIYYRARPTLWADTSAASFTNLDTQAQEAVILWTCCRMLEAVQRGDESKDIFAPQYEDRIQKLKDSMARRSVPKSAQVTDVRTYSYPSGSPPWF